MSQLSSIARPTRDSFIAVMLVALLAGCGGGGSSASVPAPPSGDTPPPAPIEGVATPTSVAVVTATNAQ